MGGVLLALVLVLGAALPAHAAQPPPVQQLLNGADTGEPCQQPAPEGCKRLRYYFGPLPVTPGNNFQLFGPAIIEKPLEDGYVTRLEPDLVRADGSVPPTEQLHLHHATWLNAARDGLTVPFFAAGEEKTIFEPRRGYGYLIKGDQPWMINYMLHNGTPRLETMWIMYELDFTPRAAAERQGLKELQILWLDVLRDSERKLYPVFNVEKGSGAVNPATGERECAFPRDDCARFDPFGRPQPGNGKGWDYEVPHKWAGTLVFTAGHVHPGGLRTELSLVREIDGVERERRIFNSEAKYFDPNGPVSWDMAMTMTDEEWRVQVKPGDKLRLNGVYESDRASWYEGMAIMMAGVAPGERSGVDPFATYVRRKRVKPKRAKRLRRQIRAGKRKGRVVCRGKKRKRCRLHVRKPVPIDLAGHPTHGHLPENDNHGGRRPTPLPDVSGQALDRIGIAGFRYLAGDLSSVGQQGVPSVRYDRSLTFDNYDAFAGIWHTVTTCKAPCSGSTGISYPIANDDARLDSLELGVAPASGSFQAAAGTTQYEVRPQRDGLEPGATYTYFCRIHPFMRGAFKVVK
jgi:hypothetical protein